METTTPGIIILERAGTGTKPAVKLHSFHSWHTSSALASICRKYLGPQRYRYKVGTCSFFILQPFYGITHAYSAINKANPRLGKHRPEST